MTKSCLILQKTMFYDKKLQSYFENCFFQTPAASLWLPSGSDLVKDPSVMSWLCRAQVLVVIIWSTGPWKGLKGSVNMSQYTSCRTTKEQLFHKHLSLTSKCRDFLTKNCDFVIIIIKKKTQAPPGYALSNLKHLLQWRTSGRGRWDFLSGVQFLAEGPAACRGFWRVSLQQQWDSQRDWRDGRQKQSIINNEYWKPLISFVSASVMQHKRFFTNIVIINTISAETGGGPADVPAVGVAVAVDVSLTSAAGSRTLQDIFMHGQNCGEKKHKEPQSFLLIITFSYKQFHSQMDNWRKKIHLFSFLF